MSLQNKDEDYALSRLKTTPLRVNRSRCLHCDKVLEECVCGDFASENLKDYSYATSKS